MFCTTLQDPLGYFLHFGPDTDRVFWFGFRVTDIMPLPKLNYEIYINMLYKKIYVRKDRIDIRVHRSGVINSYSPNQMCA